MSKVTTTEKGYNVGMLLLCFFSIFGLWGRGCGEVRRGVVVEAVIHKKGWKVTN